MTQHSLGTNVVTVMVMTAVGMISFFGCYWRNLLTDGLRPRRQRLIAGLSQAADNFPAGVHLFEAGERPRRWHENPPIFRVGQSRLEDFQRALPMVPGRGGIILGRGELARHDPR